MTSDTVGVKDIRRVKALQARLDKAGKMPSQREAVTWAVDVALGMLEKGAVTYERRQLDALMRVKTIKAAARNTEAALRAFDKEAVYSVVADAETGNMEITRRMGGESRTVILVEKETAIAGPLERLPIGAN